MRLVLEGCAWVFGDHVNTDQILPGRFLDRPADEVGRYALTGLDATFPERVAPGDLVVAGVNFGCGSSRETAVLALKQAGVSAVIARSFARIFFRNAINNGLPAVIIGDTTGIGRGDRLRLDLSARTVTNLTTGAVLPVQNVTGTSLEILRHGGIVAYTLARIGQRGGQP
ncbi:MAG: 3-isopropylmalate dehydratase [Armatimonadota bacterium]|nr:3-isopropylmalate dehydratase [Armatimonadota bacterium]MDR7549961.1 3-isopropylmalate dehydratase [Armatimonadota bacterium]